MTKEERSKKISELYHFCNMQDSCDPCELEDLSFDCDFNGMNEKKINSFYDMMVGYKTRVGEDNMKEKPKTITENLTGVIKEDHERTKTVSDILEEVKQEICDDYCKYPTQVDSEEDLFADDSPCMMCPLSRL